MKLAQKLINLPVISINNGTELGRVRDLYLDNDLLKVTAIHLGSEGILNRTESFIRKVDVITFGKDAVLVRNSDFVLDEADNPEMSEWKTRWMRRDSLRGTEIMTPGKTKIGRISDVIIDEEANIAGFSLAESFVSGPVADNMAVSRTAVVEPLDGIKDGFMTAELKEAEQAGMRIESETIFSRPKVKPVEEPEAEVA